MTAPRLHGRRMFFFLRPGGTYRTVTPTAAGLQDSHSPDSLPPESPRRSSPGSSRGTCPNLRDGDPGKTCFQSALCGAAYHVAHKVMSFLSVLPLPEGFVYDVHGLNTSTPVATTALVLRVTRVRLCRMAVAARSPSITGSADFALSACAAIRPQRSATA
jgi:hypothetical protein